jgi:hypothetical protein
MAFAEPGQEVNVDYFNEQIFSLGINDTSTPELNERRMFQDGTGGYLLKFYNGSSWENVSAVNSRISSGAVEKLYIQSGSNSIGASLTTIPFPEAFVEVFTVVASVHFDNASYAYSCQTRNLSTTSFRAWIFDNSGTIRSGTVNWIALGR